ncbi:hypothetical protein [uncultured Granulicatella sp.]|uniref:hypothetical protein n=1 Tax=uncultured Granulicatella sp. TaxID=316089 RepID=UPI0028D5685B|nr:hypothetical protein [uncultured Granulicatella sp.]
MPRFYQLLKFQILDYLRILLIGLGSYLGVINVLNFIDRSEGFSFTINLPAITFLAITLLGIAFSVSNFRVMNQLSFTRIEQYKFSIYMGAVMTTILTLKSIFFYVLSDQAASVGIQLIQWPSLETNVALGTLSLWGWLLVMYLFTSALGLILNKFTNQKIVLVVTSLSLGGTFVILGILAHTEAVNNFLDKMKQYNLPLSYVMIAVSALLLYVVTRHHESKEVGVGM